LLNKEEKDIGLNYLSDLKSYEVFFNTHFRALVHYANTILNDIDDAEDKVQHVFITLWEKRMTLELHTSPRAFLYRSVHNACLNTLKSKKVRTDYSLQIQKTQSFSSPDTRLEERDLQNKIEIAIQSLPTQCGIIFSKSRFEHLKYQEIADQMGLSVKTVENQMGKALKILREQLKDYLPFYIFILLKSFS